MPRTGKATSWAVIGVLLLACGRLPSAEELPWRIEECRYRIVLRCPLASGRFEQGPAVFFIDLSRLADTAVDTQSMRLVRVGDGQSVPFSLDYRYGDRRDLPLPKPRYPDPTGYWGHKYPAAEEELRRLGFISFLPQEGEQLYALEFGVCQPLTPAQARPRPDIRPWWIEQCRDPTFALNEKGGVRPDLYGSWRREGWRHVTQPSPEGEYCYELFRPDGGRLISMPGLFDFDRRIAGRRVILYHLLYAENGLTGRTIYLPLPSALRTPSHIALHFSFGDIPPRTWYALCVEGRVSRQFKTFEKRLYANYNEPCLLGAFHLQFPPERASANMIDIGTDLASVGDRVPLTWKSCSQPYLYPVTLPLQTPPGADLLVEAERVESWPDGFRLEAQLTAVGAQEPLRSMCDTSEPGRTWRGFLPLGDLRPGVYTVHLTVFSQREPAETVARITRQLHLIDSPFTMRNGE